MYGAVIAPADGRYSSPALCMEVLAKNAREEAEGKMIVYKGSPERWEFYNPVHLVAGCGSFRRLPKYLGAGKVLLVTSPGFAGRGLTRLFAELISDREYVILDNVKPNPTIDRLEEDAQQLEKLNIQQLVALGGGSAIDSAKVLSFMLAPAGRGFSLRGHFERQGALPDGAPLPLLAVPTTAGTGSEVTPFATVWDISGEKKYSLASPRLFARTALLDPELTLTLPEEITIATGLDALSHALESLWNRHANLITRGYALQALGIILNTLPALTADLKNLELRSRMMEASMLAGLAISRTRTALAHSISYPITARYGMPHGLACSFTLPAILEFNAREDDGRLLEAARSLGFKSVAGLQEELIKLYRKLEVDRLVKKYIGRAEELVALIPQMFTPGRADNNLRKATPEQLQDILQSSLTL